MQIYKQRQLKYIVKCSEDNKAFVEFMYIMQNDSLSK